MTVLAHTRRYVAGTVFSDRPLLKVDQCPPVAGLSKRFYALGSALEYVAEKWTRFFEDMLGKSFIVSRSRPSAASQSNAT